MPTKAQLIEGYRQSFTFRAKDATDQSVKAQLWENPRTGQIRVFDLSKPYFRESPVPRDRGDVPSCGPWMPYVP